MPEHGEWGEDLGPAPGASAERQRLENEFLLAMRRAGSIMQLLGQVSAERIGINVTDLNCLNIVALTGPMTAGDLAKATGLTTASITGVVDRLAEAGYVTRERDPADRRRVVVRLVTERAVSDIATVFQPMVAAWQQMAEGYSDEELELIMRFYGQMAEVIRQHITVLRAASQADHEG
jgi:DNA-binding MarR family transcriptional regulator